ncbi:calcium-binding protein [Streptomyces sp. NPDC053493]|uniref:calcium-binding protein n=1 Tax=Streptomyces sp. NPDC053493 TaxID=3365705 RepID=UPI0037D22A7D
MPLQSPWRRLARASATGFASLALVLGLPAVATAAPGDLDTTFDGDGKVVTDVGGFSSVSGMAVQPDGKIVTAGYGFTLETSGDFTLVRYNTDGSLDPTFGGDGIVTTDFEQTNDEARGLALQPDGKIVVVGGSTNWGGTGTWAAARYLPNGDLDTSFGADGTGKAVVDIDVDAIETALAVAVQPDGKIVLGGESIGNWSLARLDSAGILDTTFGGGDGIVTTDFGAGCCNAVTDLALQSDGKIVAAGYSPGSFTVVRYTASGDPDTGFDGDGRVTTGFGTGPVGVVLQADGRIVIAGTDGNAFGLVRFTTTGALDPTFDGDGRVTTSFGPPAEAGAMDLALQADGRLVAAGHYAGDFALARYNTNGSLDPDFGGGDGRVTTDFGGPDDQAAQVLLQADGKIVAGGLAGTASSDNSDRGLARYLGGGGSLPPPPPSADVSVAKGGPTALSIGDTGTYTVVVRNNSTTTAATSVQLTDTFTGPAATVLSASTNRGSCAVSAGRVTCAIGTLTTAGTAGATATVTITAEPSRTGTLSDTATVTAAETDPVTGNNTATRTTAVNNNRGCTLIGTSGNDTLTGTSNADVICALSGHDVVNAGNGNDTVHAGPGDDRIDGGYQNDTLIGGPGNDSVFGNYGDDSLNTVDGVAGNDTANGGFGTDTCTTDSGDTRLSCP